MKKSVGKKVPKILSMLSVFVIVSFNTLASTGMPWEGPLSTLKKSITGPVAQVISIVTIAIAGLTWAFSEGGGMTGKAIKIVCGVAIALAATSIVGSLFDADSSGAILTILK